MTRKEAIVCFTEMKDYMVRRDYKKYQEALDMAIEAMTPKKWWRKWRKKNDK